jgi:hypothetical protein
LRGSRRGAVGACGRFVAIDEARVTHAITAGHVRYTFRCRFERQDMLMFIVFPQDGTEVVGQAIQASR